MTWRSPAPATPASLPRGLCLASPTLNFDLASSLRIAAQRKPSPPALPKVPKHSAKLLLFFTCLTRDLYRKPPVLSKNTKGQGLAEWPLTCS